MSELNSGRLTELLIILKRVNRAYDVGSEEQRGKLLDGCKGIFDELMNFGYQREFLEGLVIGGSEFLNGLGELKDMSTSEITEVIFK